MESISSSCSHQHLGTRSCWLSYPVLILNLEPLSFCLQFRGFWAASSNCCSGTVRSLSHEHRRRPNDEEETQSEERQKCLGLVIGQQRRRNDFLNSVSNRLDVTVMQLNNMFPRHICLEIGIQTFGSLLSFSSEYISRCTVDDGQEFCSFATPTLVISLPPTWVEVIYFD